MSAVFLDKTIVAKYCQGWPSVRLKMDQSVITSSHLGSISKDAVIFKFWTVEATGMSQEKRLQRRGSAALGASQSSSSDNDSQQAGAPYKSDSQSQSQSHFSPSGVSQDFFEALNFEENEQIPALSEDSVAALSVGIVPVLSRPSTNKRQKEIKPFALQKCFYACPKNMSEEQKDKIKEKIDKDIVDFKFQKYKVELHRFGLPFVVEEICCISAGYNLVPKILKAPPPPTEAAKTSKKRRRDASDEDEANARDDDDDEDYCAKTKSKKSNEDHDPDSSAACSNRSLRSMKK